MSLKPSLPNTLVSLWRIIRVKFSLSILLVALPFFPSCLLSQIPDYDMSGWVGSEFNGKADRFFRALTLQTSHHRLSLTSGSHRVTVGGTVIMTSSFTQADLTPLTGKMGLFPAIEGDFPVTSNLSLNGWYSAFSSAGDVIIAYRYGANLLLSTQWLAKVQRCHLEGPDDFFLKTVAVAIIRQINYADRHYWIGMGLGFYGAGIHVKDRRQQVTIRDRLEGGITSLFLGLNRRLGENYGVDIEIKMHPSFLSLMVGFSRILR